MEEDKERLFTSEIRSELKINESATGIKQR